MNKDLFLSEVNSISDTIESVSNKYAVPKELVIKMLTEKLQIECGLVQQFVVENINKRGRQPNWMKLVSAIQKEEKRKREEQDLKLGD